MYNIKWEGNAKLNTWLNVLTWILDYNKITKIVKYPVIAWNDFLLRR